MPNGTGNVKRKFKTNSAMDLEIKTPTGIYQLDWLLTKDGSSIEVTDIGVIIRYLVEKHNQLVSALAEKPTSEPDKALGLLGVINCPICGGETHQICYKCTKNLCSPLKLD